MSVSWVDSSCVVKRHKDADKGVSFSGASRQQNWSEVWSNKLIREVGSHHALSWGDSVDCTYSTHTHTNTYTKTLSRSQQPGRRDKEELKLANKRGLRLSAHRCFEENTHTHTHWEQKINEWSHCQYPVTSSKLRRWRDVSYSDVSEHWFNKTHTHINTHIHTHSCS